MDFHLEALAREKPSTELLSGLTTTQLEDPFPLNPPIITPCNAFWTVAVSNYISTAPKNDPSTVGQFQKYKESLSPILQLGDQDKALACRPDIHYKMVA